MNRKLYFQDKTIKNKNKQTNMYIIIYKVIFRYDFINERYYVSKLNQVNTNNIFKIPLMPLTTLSGILIT